MDAVRNLDYEFYVACNYTMSQDDKKKYPTNFHFGERFPVYEMAKKVIARDDVIDAMFDDTKKEVIELIQNHGAGAEVATDLLMVAKYFERIGDHATNIAEWVIFSINGTHPTINPEPVL